jgi:hypothetical protein
MGLCGAGALARVAYNKMQRLADGGVRATQNLNAPPAVQYR